MFGNLTLSAPSSYLNFGATSTASTGASGYGFRDNSGVMQFKNAGGTWQSVSVATSGPAFLVTLGGSDQSVSNNVATTVGWTTKTFDTNNNFNLSTGRFTPTVPGTYLITFNLDCSSNVTVVDCTSFIYKNGSSIAANDHYVNFTYANGPVTTLVQMNGTTDYITAVGTVFTTAGGGASWSFSGDPTLTYFTGTLIAPLNASPNTTLNLQYDGTETTQIDISKSFGIGTSTPWGKLSVQGTSGQLNPVFQVASSTGASFFTIAGPSGNVGIGTSTPGSLFSINGVANFVSGATSTIYGGLNITSGCFSVNGTCVSGGGSGNSFGFPFTTTTNFGSTANATNTPIWFQAGFQASSTAYFTDISTIGILNFATTSSATSSLIQIGGQDFLTASSTGNNIGLGIGALAAENHNVSGYIPAHNIAIGLSALGNLNNSGNGTFGTNNVAIGYQAGIATGIGWNNVAIGYQALTGYSISSSNSPNNNVAIGYSALYRASSGGGNTCIGTSACLSLTTGTNNFGLGSGAYLNDNTGNGNSALGANALYGLGSGKSYSIGLGYDVGYHTNASYDILIGNNVDAGNLTTDGQLNIGNFLFGAGLQNAAYSGAIATSTFGIGTTTPWARFSIAGAPGATDPLFNISSSTSGFATTSVFLIDQNGNVGLGTTTPGATLTVAGAGCFAKTSAGIGCSTATVAGDIYYGDAHAAGGFDVAEQYAAVSVGPTTPGTIVGLDYSGTSTLAVATTSANMIGIVSTNPGLTFGNYGATASTTPLALSGRVPVKVSLQNGIIQVGDRITLSSVPGVGMKAGPLDPSVGIALEPYTTFSASSSIMVFVTLQQGTDAQAIADALIGSSTGATTTPGTVTPFLSSLLAQIAQWLAGANNGIHDLYASVIHANEVHAKELCVAKSDGTEVCVTGDQLAAILAGQTAGPATGATSATPTSTSGPIISVNGNNPATITVGETYSDLGAAITGPTADLNLGIQASVDGATSTAAAEIFVDTSTAGTHTITYSAVDQNGLIGTVTRTVIVVAATGTPPADSTTDTTGNTATSTPTVIVEAPQAANAPAATTTDASSTSQ